MADLNTTIQENLLALVCYDKETHRVALSLAPPSVYNPVFRDIAEAASSHIDQWGEPPGEHMFDLMNALCERKPDIEEDARQLFSTLNEIKDGINSDYVISQAKGFRREQNLRTALTKATKLLQSGNEDCMDEIDIALTTYLKPIEDSLRTGTRLWEPDEALAFFDSPILESFPTGIPELDEYSMGPAPGRLHLFAGLSGRGKSWWLLNLAKQAMLHGKKVLFITCEMSEEEVMQRTMQNRFAITKRPQDVVRPILQKKDGEFQALATKTLKRPSLEDDGIKTSLHKRLSNSKKNRMITRYFPAGELSVRGLEAYLDVLETSDKFIPDLILLDYMDLMEVDSDNLRQSLNQMSINLKGLAMKRSVAVATATQLNADAENKSTATGVNIAEAKGKIYASDVFITYNQTAAEHSRGLARLFVVKGRSDKDKFTVVIAQNYDSGQFALDSMGVVSSYFDEVRDEE